MNGAALEARLSKIYHKIHNCQSMVFRRGNDLDIEFDV